MPHSVLLKALNYMQHQSRWKPCENDTTALKETRFKPCDKQFSKSLTRDSVEIVLDAKCAAEVGISADTRSGHLALMVCSRVVLGRAAQAVCLNLSAVPVSLACERAAVLCLLARPVLALATCHQGIGCSARRHAVNVGVSAVAALGQGDAADVTVGGVALLANLAVVCRYGQNEEGEEESGQRFRCKGRHIAWCLLPAGS
jgi:hypothetical protein